MLTPSQYERAKTLVHEWEVEIKAMTYEERKRRREANEHPFDRYWKGVEEIVLYEMDAP